MRIELLNLNETELDELRTYETEHFDQCILTVTKGAFDGITAATLIFDAVQTVATIIPLIIMWKERRNKDPEKEIVEEVEILKYFPDGSYASIKLNNATEKILLEVLNRLS